MVCSFSFLLKDGMDSTDTLVLLLLLFWPNLPVIHRGVYLQIKVITDAKLTAVRLVSEVALAVDLEVCALFFCSFSSLRCSRICSRFCCCSWSSWNCCQ